MKKEPMNAPAQNYVSPKAKEHKLAIETPLLIVSGGDDPIDIHSTNDPEGE